MMSTGNTQLRWAGAAGVASAVLIFAGQLLSSWELPGPGDDTGTWSRWAIEHEGSVEAGVYYLVVPGLFAFLLMTAALVGLQPGGVSRRLTTWGSLLFVSLMTVAGVLSSTTASTHGFFEQFEDDRSLTLLTGQSAGFHLMTIAVWGIALTIAASGVGLAAAGVVSRRLRTVSSAWAVMTAATGAVGFGLLPALIWTVAASALMLRTSLRVSEQDAQRAHSDKSLAPAHGREG